MKVLFCAYDRPEHLATGPNAWIQRLIPDLTDQYDLDIHTLIIHSGALEACPTLTFFNSNLKLPLHTISNSEVPYIEDQIKIILEIIRDNKITILVANCVMPAYYSARFLKPYNIPVIGVLHSYDTFHMGLIKKFIKGAKEDRIKVCVSVSNFINSLADSNFPDMTSEVISCGTPISSHFISRNKHDDLHIIYAGRIVSEAKQILKLAKAFINASVNNLRLSFSIYGDGNEVQQLESILGNSNNEHNVNYHGGIAPSEIQNVMAKHHVFTLMSDYEGMSVALMEAMSIGLVPVVLKGPKGIDEIVDHGVNGFIVENRDSDYQDKLSFLQKNISAWTSMSENAKSTILNKYSSAVTNKQWVNLLMEFKDNPIKNVKIPNKIKLDVDLLGFGFNRKPSILEIYKCQLNKFWFQFKLFVRPRARFRKLFNM